MNPMNYSSTNDIGSVDTETAIALQRQVQDLLPQLSPERLQVLADVAAYLVDADSEAAMAELLSIPGLLERVKQTQATPQTSYTPWRTIRSDV